MLGRGVGSSTITPSEAYSASQANTIILILKNFREPEDDTECKRYIKCTISRTDLSILYMRLCEEKIQIQLIYKRWPSSGEVSN